MYSFDQWHAKAKPAAKEETKIAILFLGIENCVISYASHIIDYVSIWLVNMKTLNMTLERKLGGRKPKKGPWEKHSEEY